MWKRIALLFLMLLFIAILLFLPIFLHAFHHQNPIPAFEAFATFSFGTSLVFLGEFVKHLGKD